MLRISRTKTGPRTIVLRLEGRIVGPWVTELRRTCDDVLREGADVELRLGLAEVEFMDADGVACLASLRARGVLLMDCPLFVAEQLKGGKDCDAT